MCRRPLRAGKNLPGPLGEGRTDEAEHNSRHVEEDQVVVRNTGQTGMQEKRICEETEQEAKGT